jgi:hypothetical protein
LPEFPERRAGRHPWARLRRRAGTARRALKRRTSRVRGAYLFLAREAPRRQALRDALVSGGALTLDTLDLALAQYVDGSCRRLDLFVRLLAIEEWEGANGGGVDLYRRFIERKSADQGWSRPTHTPEEFLRLVEDVRRRGLDAGSPVVVYPDKILLDGIHRLACALFLGLPRVPVVIEPRVGVLADYGLERLHALELPDADVEAVLAAEARYRAAWTAGRPDAP